MERTGSAGQDGASEPSHRKPGQDPRLFVAIAVALAAVIGVVIWLVAGPDEPEANGGTATGSGSPATPLRTASPTRTVTPTPTPSSTAPVDPSVWYRVSSLNSSLCLDAADNGTTSGTLLVQWSCGVRQDSQLWRFTPVSDGYYRVTNRLAPGLVWDISGGPSSQSDGDKAHLWEYLGATNQLWKPVPVGRSRMQFVVRHSGKCLDVNLASRDRGVQLQQWTCNGSNAQVFLLTRP